MEDRKNEFMDVERTPTRWTLRPGTDTREFKELCYVAKCPNAVETRLNLCISCLNKYHCTAHLCYQFGCVHCTHVVFPHHTPKD